MASRISYSSLDVGIDFTDEFQEAADELKVAIEDRIASGVPPPNAPSTKKKKGHDHTLVDTGVFLMSIETKVTNNGFEVGVWDPYVAWYAKINEDGTDTIPARPVFGPTMDGPGEAILEKLEEKIADKIIAAFETR